MRPGDRVFIDICDLHQGWAILLQPMGGGRWLVRLDEGGEIVVPGAMVRR